MNISSYTFIQPDGTPVAASLWTMAKANPFRADRLLTALESFVQRRSRASFRVAADKHGEVEIYMEPPRYVVTHIPDAVALIRVDHRNETVELIHLVEEYGGIGEQAQWKDLQRLADAALNRKSESAVD